MVGRRRWKTIEQAPREIHRVLRQRHCVTRGAQCGAHRGMVKGHRLAGVSSEYQTLRLETEQPPQRGVEHQGSLPRFVCAGFEVGPSDCGWKERIAGEQPAFADQVARALRRVTRCKACEQGFVPETHLGSVAKRLMRETRASLLRQPQAGACMPG